MDALGELVAGGQGVSVAPTAPVDDRPSTLVRARPSRPGWPLMHYSGLVERASGRSEAWLRPAALALTAVAHTERARASCSTSDDSARCRPEAASETTKLAGRRGDGTRSCADEWLVPSQPAELEPLRSSSGRRGGSQLPANQNRLAHRSERRNIGPNRLQLWDRSAWPDDFYAPK